MVVYVREIEVLDAARKAARRAELQGPMQPIGTARDLWVGLDASERYTGDYGDVCTYAKESIRELLCRLANPGREIRNLND